jgi:hypothetical protein
MMRLKIVARLLTLALIVAGTSILAAPEQTATPGQMTQARVWVQNRGRTEAMPVELSTDNMEKPLKVQVMNADPILNARPVPVTPTRPLWDYEMVTIQPTEDMAGRLNERGKSGWETTGIWSVGGDGVTKVLVKRPR